MKQRRLYEGQECVFDARDILDKRKYRGKVLMKMNGQNASFVSPSGVIFRRDHPFQLVPTEDLDFLRYQENPSFSEADIVEVEDYYTI